jgi:hypothetical protein
MSFEERSQRLTSTEVAVEENTRRESSGENTVRIQAASIRANHATFLEDSIPEATQTAGEVHIRAGRTNKRVEPAAERTQ